MKKFMILAGVVTALLFSALIYIVMGEDRTVPVIMQDNKNLIYREGEDLNLLLSGVKAEDDVDGDITSAVIVGDVVTMADKTAAKVTYFAKDSSNNVGELDVIVPYEGKPQAAEKAEAEKITGSAPVIVLTEKEAEIKVRGEFHPEEYIKDIKDDKDSIGTLLKNIMVTGDYDIKKQGTYVLLLATKDSDGNQSEEASLILKVTP
ncbi:hypothetical protein [Anaerocolumna xylanovorans]|uniref:Pesticidal crystal protein Cry22Aa Ig-like domain-containing protein n=1 Tax=Anaerocolumna xylanovorans DSM 12503 TaxID=1121345 RepID=A0A1M7YAJ7_9FIRM|nr:hypothetical protein [Anaerocolumna xylanovorans]SHO49558.1 hypothetical protein SAMN02745217_02384 [Anaerocolumna xylanovorans DSM 12503]